LKRREFIKNSIKASAYLGLASAIPFELLAKEDFIKLTILHTNDMHSRVDPFPNDGSRNANMGGMARRAAIIKQIRVSEPNVLLLDAGDIFQGTPYFNYFGGELEFKLMSQMGYDLATLGNHDFDLGLENLKKQLPHASFPFLATNYDFNNTILKDKFLPYKIFNKQGIKVGIFSTNIQLEELVPTNLFEKTIYKNPIEKAKEMVAFLRNTEKCNLVICLSHLGYKYEGSKVSDLKIAEEVQGIDLIIGGHTHTFLDKPFEVKYNNTDIALVNQVGWAGLNLGRIDYIFSRKLKKISHSSALLEISEKSRV
jgi:5'-nucleotidase